MRWKLPKFTMVRLFLFVIIMPTSMVFITIATMNNEGREYKVTHEVYFDIESDGKELGTMVFGLFGETVPRTVKNFMTFANKGYSGYKYEGTKFHRVIKKFMIQGGDVISGDGKGSISIYGPSFPDENFLVKHTRPGFISMANKGADTNGCQFFITAIATPWLDGHHVVFGKMVEGEPLLHIIEYMATDWDDKPLKDVIIAKSGRRTVKEPYYINDDPYNLYSWIKTISVPLGLSFGIIYIFSHFIRKLDEFIHDDDGSVSLDSPEEIMRKNIEKARLAEKKALLEDKEDGKEGEKENGGGGGGGGGEEKGGDKQEKKKEGDTEVRKRTVASSKDE